MWRKFIKHKLAILGGTILAVFDIVAILSEFFAPSDVYKRRRQYGLCPPQIIHFFDEQGFHFRPFVYGLESTRDPKSRRKIYTIDKSKKYPIYFFVKGDKYKLWNLFPMNIHLFGVKEGEILLFIWNG